MWRSQNQINLEEYDKEKTMASFFRLDSSRYLLLSAILKEMFYLRWPSGCLNESEEWEVSVLPQWHWLVPPAGSAKEALHESHYRPQSPPWESHCTESPHKDSMSAPCGHVTKGMTKREEFLNTNKQESRGCFRPDVYILPPKNNCV